MKVPTNTIFLAGSVPFLREADLPLPAPFKQAYRGSERLIFEVDPEAAKDEREGQQSIVMGMFTEGGSIRDHLSQETSKKLDDFLSAAGAPRGGMNQLRPWFAAIMISMAAFVPTKTASAFTAKSLRQCSSLSFEIGA